MKLHEEDYDLHWGYIDYNDKVVLDLGADYGSTAKFFLGCGARQVIAVEYDSQYLGALNKFRENNNTIVVQRFVRDERDFDELINLYRSDVVKVDIEGGEIGLLDVDCDTLNKVPEYAIEYHGGNDHFVTVNHHYTAHDLHDLLVQKFKSCGFTVTDQACFTIYARRLLSHEE